MQIEGVLSGTLSYIFNTWQQGQRFSDVVAQAKALGYTEPDPREDLSGQGLRATGEGLGWTARDWHSREAIGTDWSTSAGLTISPSHCSCKVPSLQHCPARHPCTAQLLSPLPQSLLTALSSPSHEPRPHALRPLACLLYTSPSPRDS